jgi:glutaredoxin 3
MLTLYYKPSCPFCQTVLGEAEALNIKLDLKNTAQYPEYQAELISFGGKQLVPFLIDTDRGVQLYESNDIISHLNQYYASPQTNSFGGLRVHKSEEVCDTCQ